jgi:hypothetical protein
MSEKSIIVYCKGTGKDREHTLTGSLYRNKESVETNSQKNMLHLVVILVNGEWMQGSEFESSASSFLN